MQQIRLGPCAVHADFPPHRFRHALSQNAKACLKTLFVRIRDRGADFWAKEAAGVFIVEECEYYIHIVQMGPATIRVVDITKRFQ